MRALRTDEPVFARPSTSARVGDVAIGTAKGHRDMAVSAHGEDEQQLLKVRAMGLGMSVRDGRCAVLSNDSPCGTPVVAAKAHRSAVVVKLVQTQTKAPPSLNKPSQATERQRSS